MIIIQCDPTNTRLIVFPWNSIFFNHLLDPNYQSSIQSNSIVAFLEVLPRTYATLVRHALQNIILEGFEMTRCRIYICLLERSHLKVLCLAALK